MARVLLFGLCWVTSIVVQISAQAAVDCLDNNICRQVKIIAREPRDITYALKKYQSAQMVDLHGNLITNFPSHSLGDVRSLQTFNLSYNLVKDDLFLSNWNQQLKVVDLTYNQLETVTIPPSVTTFLAQRNQLWGLTVQSNNQLKELILSKNRFESLNSFTGLSKLTKLDLSCNRIREISFDTLSRMPSLSSLNLANNHIYTMYGTGRLYNLHFLDLSSNILTLIGDISGNIPTVRTLRLQHNQIVMSDVNMTTFSQLTEVDVSDNDWDCKKLTSCISGVNQRSKINLISDTKQCELSVRNICCTNAGSIYAERLIMYHKREFLALQTGTKYRTEGANCSAIKPSPCDGDNDLVYKVAAASTQTFQRKAKSNVESLKASFSQEQNYVTSVKANKQKMERATAMFEGYLNNLTSFINAEYETAGLANSESPLLQLQEIFRKYESENDQYKSDIKQKQQENVDELDKINLLEKTMEDLRYSVEFYLEKFQTRNQTVENWKKKISDLELRKQRASAV